MNDLRTDGHKQARTGNTADCHDDFVIAGRKRWDTNIDLG